MALVQAIRLLVDKHDAELSVYSLDYFRGSEEAFLAIRDQIDVSYYDQPFKTRVKLAAELARSPETNSPSLFRLALQAGTTLPVEVENESNELLHSIAGAIGSIIQSTLATRHDSRGKGVRDYHKNLPGTYLMPPHIPQTN